MDVFNRQLKSKAGDWECIEFYHTYDCEYDPSEGMVICTIVDTHCVTWVYVEEPPISGGGGGFPGNDPGECDPMGTEPCFDGGVGSSIPPPEPDPCEEINPPAWCSCEETDDPNLDNKGVKEQVYSLMEASNANDPDQNKRKEQGMWIIKDPNTGEYGYSLFDEGWSNFTACGIEYDNPIIPPNTVAMIHTQPFEIGEIPYPCEEGRISKAQLDAFIQINPALRDQYEYKGTPSANDLQLVQTIQNQNSDIQFYLVDKEGITEYDETSTTDDLSNSTRHTQSCFQN